MRYQKYRRTWGPCLICKEDFKKITTTKEDPYIIYCDDCKVNRKEEYDLHVQKLNKSAEENRLKREKEKEEAEKRYYKELEREEEDYQFLADNEVESYEDWLSSEYGDDASDAYWNNE